jgi:uracil-DNA glycosylase
MSDTEPTVYLQDIAVPASVKLAVAPATDKPAVVAAGTSKRQRTLLDMFGSQENAPSAKKKKVIQSSTASAGSLKKVSSTAPSQATEALDSVPFDVTAFRESLSDEHKKLLQLECEVMGPSWQVFLKFFRISMHEIISDVCEG